jgi:hypothetical protein
MKTSALIKRHAAFGLLTGLSYFLFAGCAFEVENPDNPSPISPRDRASGADNANMPDSKSGNKGTSQPAQTIPLPSVNCSVSIARGEANSSGKEGAAIVLAEASASDGSTLLLRTLSTGSFIEVKDLVFGGGVFSSGLYTFEYHKPNGSTCFVRLNLEANDIQQKIKISITASQP